MPECILPNFSSTCLFVCQPVRSLLLSVSNRKYEINWYQVISQPISLFMRMMRPPWTLEYSVRLLEKVELRAKILVLRCSYSSGLQLSTPNMSSPAGLKITLLSHPKTNLTIQIQDSRVNTYKIVPCSTGSLGKRLLDFNGRWYTSKISTETYINRGSSSPWLPSPRLSKCSTGSWPKNGF